MSLSTIGFDDLSNNISAGLRRSISVSKVEEKLNNPEKEVVLAALDVLGKLAHDGESEVLRYSL